jgi:hypothetical protein
MQAYAKPFINPDENVVLNSKVPIASDVLNPIACELQRSRSDQFTLNSV